MKSTLKNIFASLIAICCFSACDILGLDEDTSIIFPTYRGFKIDKTTLSGGDTLHIKAYISKKGQYLYKCNFNWYMEVDTLCQESGATGKMLLHYSIKSTNATPISLNDETTAKFVIPENIVTGTQRTNFSFQVEYEHAAAGTPKDKETPAEEGYLGGTFVYRVMSVLYSRITNNFTTSLTFQ